MVSRGTVLLLSAVAGALGPSCLPLEDLDSYGQGNAGGGGTGGADSAVAGAGGGDDVGEGWTCGDGALDEGEACDDAGSSVSCAADCTTRQCGLGCRCWMEDGDLLTFCTARVAFSTAAQSCDLIGGFFNVPESAEENARLIREATVSGYQEMWVGASDSDSEGTWVDGDGEVFWEGGATGAPVGGHYAGWDTGQPNNTAMMEHCAVLEESGKWNDRDCAAINIYSCRTRAVLPERCGDGALDADEFCDDGADSAACDEDCTASLCGDGHVNAEAGEECDAGASWNPGCSDCKSTGLVLRFPLTERRGVTAYDSTLFTRVGTLFGDASFPSTANGLALSTAGALVLPVDERPAVTGQITLMALVKPSALPVGTQDIVEFYSATEETFLRFEDAFLQVGAWVEGGPPDVAELDMTSALTLGVFTHVAGTYDGARWQLYVDGVKVGEFESTRAALAPDGPFVVGGREDLTRGFGGRILDARVYDRALSEDELLSISDALEVIWP